MTIVNIQKLLENAMVGKRIVPQPNLNPIYFGATIISVTPCSYNYDCDNGYIIQCDNSLYLTIDCQQEIAAE
jgi:hypothetical protein